VIVLNSSNHTHIKIIEACKKGNRQAQYELYQLYSKPMYNVALRIVQKRDDAEDVLQECFIDMFNKLDSWRGESSFGIWFKRIVVNRSINYIKKKKLNLVDEIKAVNISEDEKEDDLEEITYSVEQVKAAMNELPDGYRIVFSLYNFEDYSHKQIAEELSITESTSKSQLNRAKNRMRELLNQIII
jgi:RNA polymerase sigma factor (sigma-70 family)